MDGLRHIFDRHLDLLVVDVMCADQQHRLVSHELLEDLESILTYYLEVEKEKAGAR